MASGAVVYKIMILSSFIYIFLFYWLNWNNSETVCYKSMNYFPFAIVEMSEGRKNLLNKSLKEKQTSLEWPPTDVYVLRLLFNYRIFSARWLHVKIIIKIHSLSLGFWVAFELPQSSHVHTLYKKEQPLTKKSERGQQFLSELESVRRYLGFLRQPKLYYSVFAARWDAGMDQHWLQINEMGSQEWTATYL